MKNIKPSVKILFPVLLTTIAILISSCYKRIDLEIEYSDYRRVIGPEGGEINFYEYKPDSVDRIIVNMKFPEGALDSTYVFNMYEYHNPSTYSDVYWWPIGVIEQSKYLYFIPFPESLGYNEFDYGTLENDPSVYKKHYTVNFNKPVTVTYYVNDFGFADTLKLFNIDIPSENEWGTTDYENVWIKLNQQLYPDGYDDLDLFYLITGRWTDTNWYGSDYITKDNWTEMIINPTTDLDYENRTITFDITSTDFMYLMGYKNEWYLK